MPTAVAPPARGRRPSHRRASAAGGAHRGRAASARPRVRWDRVGRMALLLVLAVLVYLYLSAGVRMLSTWRQARRDGAAVMAMKREHTLLLREHESLGRRGTLEQEARRLGMMRTAEQPYVVNGLPNN